MRRVVDNVDIGIVIFTAGAIAGSSFIARFPSGIVGFAYRAIPADSARAVLDIPTAFALEAVAILQYKRVLAAIGFRQETNNRFAVARFAVAGQYPFTRVVEVFVIVVYFVYQSGKVFAAIF